jgi:hypothetical protein
MSLLVRSATGAAPRRQSGRSKGVSALLPRARHRPEQAARQPASGRRTAGASARAPSSNHVPSLQRRAPRAGDRTIIDHERHCPGHARQLLRLQHRARHRVRQEAARARRRSGDAAGVRRPARRDGASPHARGRRPGRIGRKWRERRPPALTILKCGNGLRGRSAWAASQPAGLRPPPAARATRDVSDRRRPPRRGDSCAQCGVGGPAGQASISAVSRKRRVRRSSPTSRT